MRTCYLPGFCSGTFFRSVFSGILNQRWMDLVSYLPEKKSPKIIVHSETQTRAPWFPNRESSAVNSEPACSLRQVQLTAVKPCLWLVRPPITVCSCSLWEAREGLLNPLKAVKGKSKFAQPTCCKLIKNCSVPVQPIFSRARCWSCQVTSFVSVRLWVYAGA